MLSMCLLVMPQIKGFSLYETKGLGSSDFIFILCVWVFYLCAQHAHGGQRRTLDLWNGVAGDG